MAGGTLRLVQVDNSAGFGINIGVFQLTPLVINANMIDFLLPADVLDHSANIIPGIEHHGVMGAEFDGIAQPVGIRHHMRKNLFFLIFNINVGPNRNRKQQGDADDDNQLVAKAVTQAFYGRVKFHFQARFYD
jgi:hypothetical protein